MEIEDFKRFFYATTICHYKPNYEYFGISDTHSVTGHAICRLEVGEDIDAAVTFSLNQMHKRFSKGWPDQEHEYAPV